MVINQTKIIQTEAWPNGSIKTKKQAGAELCQAQVKLGVTVYIGVKVDVEIAVEI